MVRIKSIKRKQLESLVERNATRWLRRFGDKLLKDIKKNTPEDSYDLTNNYQVKLIVEWDKITYKIINDMDYFLYVEYWVQGRTYNYYKGWWRRAWWSPFYTGVWARMVTKAIDGNQLQFQKDLSVEIQQWL